MQNNMPMRTTLSLLLSSAGNEDMDAFCSPERNRNTEKAGWHMACSELIKSFGRLRTCTRSFCVYGFKHRGVYNKNSAHACDDVLRRIHQLHD